MHNILHGLRQRVPAFYISKESRAAEKALSLNTLGRTLENANGMQNQLLLQTSFTVTVKVGFKQATTVCFSRFFMES